MSTVAIMPPYRAGRACCAGRACSDDSGLPGRVPKTPGTPPDPGRPAWTRSPLHRARGQAGDHEPAEDEHQDADGDHRHHAGGEDGPERDLVRDRKSTRLNSIT